MYNIHQVNIQNLSGIGEKKARLYCKLGITTIEHLLRHYPRTYEDWSRIIPIIHAPFGESCCVKAVITSPCRTNYIRKGMTLYKFTASDTTSQMKITLFNNKFLAEKLKEGEEFLFYGKIGGTFTQREMVSPEIELVQNGQRIHPIYRQTEGLTSRMIENAVRQSLKYLEQPISDPLPPCIRESFQLCALSFALKNIHFPDSQEALEQARRRLAFEELLLLQLGLFRIKHRSQQPTSIKIHIDCTEEFYHLLPFSPTQAQRRTVKEALSDMLSGTHPMSRLVQGDVGSGKTAVAAALCHTVIRNGYQTVMMAPTEILAAQHYQSLSGLFEKSGIRTALLTGFTSAAEKKKIKSELSEGNIDFIIGTHALIQDDVTFQNLGLVVTDEQHRFGVAQRTALTAKGRNPHMLVMSATPIPRTLALIIYGDLDISLLDELPPGRQPIATFAVGQDKHTRIYNYIKKFLDQGRQGYIVCPLIEDNGNDLTPAQEYYKKLADEVFGNYRLGLLHGKMKATEKDAVMDAFSKNQIQLLVSTTVIEVGVDVPNAVIIVIENAERFGLSQLHQLRGRVGRGKYPSTCILVSDAQNQQTIARLKIMTQTNNGFEIADEDLKLRGPGDFFGSRQHGLPDLKIADLYNDSEILYQTQTAARKLLTKDPDLSLPEHTDLRQEVETLFKSTGTI